MKIKNCKKLGISMVALVITIIVLIILTAAVVITGVNAPKQAQLAVFYSNIDTVQDLVSLKMGNNMITAAMSGLDNNYKWTGIVENPATAFTSTIEGIEENMAPIMIGLLDKTTLENGEKSKYYVGESGKVYYQGFEYEGKTYYNKDKMSEGNNPIEVVVPVGITANDVAEHPTEYYGAVVNYQNELGNTYKDNHGQHIQWRIFHAEEGNIYITTSGPVGARWLTNSVESDEGHFQDFQELRINKETYLNDTYAEWARDGIEFSMFASSYNKVKGSNATIEVNGNETDGFDFVGALSNEYYVGSPEIARLSGLQEDLYNYGNKYGNGSLSNYWLASHTIGYFVMGVECIRGEIGSDYYFECGIRPLVKLKSNIRLVESGVLDANGYMTYNLTVSSVQPTETPHEAISTTDSFVGYYADIDGNGDVDGVIYADLLAGADGQWHYTAEYPEVIYEYTINTIPSSKEYYVSQESYTDAFGEHPVISPMGEGADRFYIMALSDISTSRYYWYYNAYSYNNYTGISDYATITKEGFGEGRTNTSKMLAKWNAGDYGVPITEPNQYGYMDMWGAIASEVLKGWFVPSQDEWSAFGDAFEIDDMDDMGRYGLSYDYWSSSLYDAKNAWYIADFIGTIISRASYIAGTYYVRLTNTF